MSRTYQTRLKFMPVIVNETECHSSTSGKRFDMRDNNYPNKMDYIYEYKLYDAKDVVDFV